jgi:hypothetical protein
VRVLWQYLGEAGGKHYYISRDRVAALITPRVIEDSLEFGDGELYMRIADEVCELARAQPYAYVRLPRGAPPLLHLHASGELWLALDDWPKPRDVLRVGRLPYAGPEAVCSIEYVLDVARRERAHGAYVRVVRRRSVMFHFQVYSSTVIVAGRAW